ncbi:heavy metal-transporting P-type ATPase [Gracilibacillus halophilus YIM-C55.5]|uniref:Heavy metal-transporting P-type ATPase n=1 Tax=Gracilibacillus halophilus YIM-C55.5 TaxID=1308866 RepID=N4WCK6_9BACI|nr:heavy metal translocating P-type ATPase [Gracilibacillus halophilus]ENH98003.1 heavy metal-transporting P-type ATPase [Gracilibacillus halophilus YIM-C55.5]
MQYDIKLPRNVHSQHRLNSLWHICWMHRELIAALFSGVLILLAWLLHDNLSNLAWHIFILSAFVIGGYAKAKEGITETIQNRTLNVELLMIIAAIGAASIGYWTEGAILIFIFALSGALETYTENKNEKEMETLMNLQPEEARLVINEHQERMISVSKLKIGDQIWVKAGERIPADGKITKGETTVDESALTGESIPLSKSTNEEVYGGTMNQNSSIMIEITTLPKETIFQKIIHLVQSAQNAKSPSQLFIERFENTYVKVVLITVAVMMILPHFLFGWTWTDTIYRAMILLVVASPCALVASIMPATLSAISRGARNGTLFKGGVHVENLANISTIAFDKTGTLTEGKPVVTDFVFRENIDLNQMITTIASIEREANHPLAHAILQWCKSHHIEPTEAMDQVNHVNGKGIEAYINGSHWRIGNAQLVGKEFVSAFHDDYAFNTDGKAKTTIYIQRNNEIMGALLLQDRLRDESIQAIQDLQKLGIETVMLTGDNQSTAEAIAHQAGIDQVKANCLPEDKVEALRQFSEQKGKVAMIGDGINDAPALATADVGIAMGTGTDVALDTADMILMKNRLAKTVDAIKLSKKMNRIVKQNIAFSIGVIAILIASNFLQVIDMPLGVLGHEGSTILVILNGLRLLKN